MNVTKIFRLQCAKFKHSPATRTDTQPDVSDVEYDIETKFQELAHRGFLTTNRHEVTAVTASSSL